VGANELSIGAQSLSQSSSEQSATMDKLHESAAEIAGEAAENAERAAEASVLTTQIRANATEGGLKMIDMTSSMNEINKASHSIGSVMKVIDEIAFQTNILALNAAVEAARAGAHGKGFAVVADEVRNLATKSGEAANDTNAMIADTISKSDMGTKIVDEAIAFFKTIEEGIANINELLNEIAKAAKSQSHAIENVTKSLTDMTNVVYHNSATSEQSAAASEQMSSQALLLKEAVNRFLLEDDSERYITALEAEKPVRQYNEPVSLPGTEEPVRMEQAEEYQPFNDSLYSDDMPAYNPTVAPSEDGGLSPAEQYAKALKREAPGIEAAPAPPYKPAQASPPTPTQAPTPAPALADIQMPRFAQATAPGTKIMADDYSPSALSDIQMPSFLAPKSQEPSAEPAPKPYTAQAPAPDTESADSKLTENKPVQTSEAAPQAPQVKQAPIAAPFPKRIDHETEGGFVDDNSKY